MKIQGHHGGMVQVAHAEANVPPPPPTIPPDISSAKTVTVTSIISVTIMHLIVRMGTVVTSAR